MLATEMVTNSGELGGSAGKALQNGNTLRSYKDRGGDGT